MKYGWWNGIFGSDVAVQFKAEKHPFDGLDGGVFYQQNMKYGWWNGILGSDVTVQFGPQGSG